jgi:3'-phosphoadenosine 5'-phosphosulfate sulfotransferase (PAPS reductase)/FAD synthetase
MADLVGIDRRENKENEKYKELQKGNIPSGSLYRVKRLKGELKKKNGEQSQFNQVKYNFMLDAPFEISDVCCDVMKKAPSHKYSKETGRQPIMATMCEESRLRTEKWLQFGCNAFDAKNPASKPMSFWTEQDVYQYILENNLEIASVYGDIVDDYSAAGQCDGQLDFVNKQYPKKTTGCHRTGCMFCGFGCHLEKPGEGRFEKMKETHPQIYDYVMRPTDQGGLNYREIIKWINENGGFNIQT